MKKHENTKRPELDGSNDSFELVPPPSKLDDSDTLVHTKPLRDAYVRRRTPVALAENIGTPVDKLPKALYWGDLVLGQVTIRCAVLDDGTRVITQRSFNVALGRHKNPQKGQSTTDDRPAFLAAKNLDEHFTDDLRKNWSPIQFKSQGGYMGNVAFGYRAELLPMVCYVFIDAHEQGKLTTRQEATAVQCKILVRGLATVGIIALVDEATGYQEVRDRIALQKILDRYVRDEWGKVWASRFGAPFYKELFRLRSWEFNEESTQRPMLAAKLTNDIVYARLAPGVLKALKERVPRNDRGKPKSKLHMGLTDNIGIPELEDHLKLVVGFMQASRTYNGFTRLLDRVKPRYDLGGNKMPINTEMHYPETSDEES